MGIGIRFFVLAVGATLAIVVNATVAGIDTRIVLGILLAVGSIGLIAAAAFLSPSRRRKNTAYQLSPHRSEP